MSQLCQMPLGCELLSNKVILPFSVFLNKKKSSFGISIVQNVCHLLGHSLFNFELVLLLLFQLPRSRAPSRNSTRIQLILLCHFITWNQKLQCSDETFRLGFYGIQGVPPKIELNWSPDFGNPQLKPKFSSWILRGQVCQKLNFFGTPLIP